MTIIPDTSTRFVRLDATSAVTGDPETRIESTDPFPQSSVDQEIRQSPEERVEVSQASGTSRARDCSSWWSRRSTIQQVLVYCVMLAAFFASVFWLYDVADTNGLRHRPSLIFAVLTATPVFMVITKRFGIYSN